MSVEAIARKWHNQLLRTDPVDHHQAEAAVRAVYRLAGLAEPDRFLWCASPLEAALAVLVLVGKTEGYNHAVYEDVERSKAGKEKLALARAAAAAKLGISEDQVGGRFGQPFYRAEGTNPVTRKLTEECIDSWMAKAEAGDDFLAVHKQGPFKPLHDLEHALHYEGYRLGDGAQKPALLREAMAKAGGKHVEIVGGRSAMHRLYGNMAYTDVAVEESLAEAGKFEPTALQRAMWVAYEACGMWWPCEAGVVFSERPVAVEGNGDGVAMLWSDGLAIGEISGPVPAASALRPTPVPAKPESAVLRQPLPADHSARIAELRKSGSLPLFERYLAGEHGPVWQELIALGEDVRGDAHAADALAVAYETMHRVEQNVRLIAGRLKQMDYRFIYPGSGGGFFGFGKAQAHEPHVPPPADAREEIAAVEAAAGGPLPLSLRAFFEVVGEVNFNGDHPALAPADSHLTPDPLMVLGVGGAIPCLDSHEEDERELGRPLDFAPDALHKANISGGEPYSIMLPAAAADAMVDGEPHNVHFVEYLRIAILGWGGFPGWEHAGSPHPSELDRLRTGLIPF